VALLIANDARHLKRGEVRKSRREVIVVDLIPQIANEDAEVILGPRQEALILPPPTMPSLLPPPPPEAGGGRAT
jgi:hypothetical protein